MKRIASLLLGVCLAACATGSETRDASQASAYADFLIGRVANLRDDHAIASDRYYAALKSSPRNRDVIEGGARAALATGNIERAQEIARVARDSDVPAVRLVRAADALNAGRWSSARAVLDQLQGEIDEEFAARFITLWSKAAEGRVDEAVADLRQLSAPRPFSGIFIYQEALALDMAGRNDAAREAYTRAMEEGLWAPPALVRHADLLARMGDRPAAQALLTEASAGGGESELEAALRRLNAGERVAEQPITAQSGTAIGLYAFGALLTQESDAEAGLVSLSLALMLDPKLDAAQVAIAEAQRDLGRGDAARATLAKLPATSPYAESARLMSAWILRQEGRENEAIAAARTAAEGGAPRANLALADLYRSFERYGEAEPIYTQLIDGGINEWRLYFARGAVRERLGRWPEGEADLRRALQISPEQPEVMNYLGYTWVDRGEHLTAGLEMLQRAVALRPQSGAILDSLGWAYYRLGRYNEAIEYLERAVELEPSDPTLMDHLGDGYWRVGRRLEARFQWRRVLTLQDATAELKTTVERKIEAGLPASAAADAR